MLINLAIKKSAGKISFSFQFVFILFAALSLSSCGGGGGGSDGSTPTGGTDTTSPIGAIDNPVILNYPGSFAHSNNIALTELGKYFKITGLTPGQDFKLTLTSSDAVRLNVYDFVDYTSRSCQSSSYCLIAGNAQGEAYVEAEWSSISGTATSYNYSLNLSSTNFEGSISGPVDLTGLLPYSKTISADLAGYYFVSGLTPGNRYGFRLILPVGSDSDIFIYQNAFVSQACASTYTSNGSDEYCSFTAASDTAWIKIRANEGGDFELTLTDEGLGRNYTAAGSVGAEVELTLDSVSGSSQVDYTASYYHISGLDSTRQYRTVVDTNWYDDNVDIYVYADSSYSTLLCSSTVVAPITEVCLNGTSASGELWIKVDGSVAHNELGNSYFIHVYTYYPNEGTSAEPVQLSFSGANPLHSGTVDSRSYYQVNGLVAGESYIVDITNLSNHLTKMAVGGANPVGFFTADCESPSWDLMDLNLTCIVEATASGTLSIRTEVDWAHIGSSYDISVSLSPHQSEGDIDAPINLALVTAQLPHAGSIGGAPSYYAITGLTADQAYTISMDGAPSHPLTVYTNATMLNTGSVCYADSPAYGVTIRQCTIRALGDTLWVKVGDHTVGGNYTLDAILSPYQSEGSQAMPIAMSLGVDPVQGVVRQGTVSVDASYYQLTGLTVGETYAIAVSNIDSSYNHALYVYDNVTSFSNTDFSGYVCSSLNISTNWGDGYCFITATDTSVWVRLRGDNGSSGAQFDISARLQPVAENLLLDYSVANTFPRTGSVALNTDSVYSISGLSPNELYEISLTNKTDGAVISSYGIVCSGCIKQANATGEISITVTSSNSLYGAFYTLGISAGYVNEGTSSAPFVLTYVKDSLVDDFPSSRQVGSSESFYKVTGLLANRLYEIYQTNLTAAAGLQVYLSANFTSPACNLWSNTIENKFCGMTSTAAGELYISVPVDNGLGAALVLDVVEGLNQEGAPGAEVVHAITSSPLAGTVDKSSSYYEITGLNGATDYYVVFNSPTDNINVSVFQDNTYTFSNCQGSTNGIAAACVARTANGGAVGSKSLFVRVSGTFTEAGAQYSLEVLPPTASEGLIDTPIVLDYVTVNATPYAGQVGAPNTGDTYSYYRLDNLTAASSYTLSMATQQDRANLHVYTSAADLLSGTSTCNALTAAVGDPQVCTVTSAGTSLWIKIGSTLSTGNDGTYFSLSATP